ncbi:MAG: penicillin-binding protein 1C [Gammaproteobacteria bacterium]|nr:MAG: penicillin-binding protein 1C [Gammaproteobacteria bacterium]
MVTRSKVYLKRLKNLLLAAALLWLLTYAALLLLDTAYPPDLSRYKDISTVVTDRHGQWLRVYLSRDDKRRIATRHQQLPKDYLSLLINYEDRHFYRHNGIDVAAIFRALWQNMQAGKTVSGASTLTMQTAKLLTPRPRTLNNKIIEAFRAWQLERRFTKAEILDMYVTLAPVGGNREGLTAAAHYYLNKPVAKLSLAESAWLVALPQSPGRLSRNDAAAISARNKVLKRALDHRLIDARRYRQALAEPLTITRTPFPLLAPHLSDYSLAKAQKQISQQNSQKANSQAGPPAVPGQVTTSLDKTLQSGLHQVLAAQLPLQQHNANLAAAILHNGSGEWLAYVGSADFFAASRQGQVDMLSAVRSPGSTLKPFITLLAFDWLNYQPQTTIDDTPITAAYHPGNYDGLYQGQMTLADALLRSRNVPAVRLLQKIKPDYFVSHLQKHGLTLFFPKQGSANLSVALGGVGVRGDDLAKSYRRLANCAYGTGKKPAIADSNSCRQVTHILRQSQDGKGRVFFGREPLAFKTGTAYGWRDRWLFAYSKDYTIVLWSGRADGQFAERRASAEALIPVLRQVVGLLPHPPTAYQSFKSANTSGKQLPPRLRHVSSSQREASLSTKKQHHRELRIAAPLPGSTIDYRRQQALNLHVRDGSPPFIYLLNDRIFAQTADRQVTFQPTVSGSYHLLVIDSKGSSAESHFYLQPQPHLPTGRRAVFHQ